MKKLNRQQLNESNRISQPNRRRSKAGGNDAARGRKEVGGASADAPTVGARTEQTICEAHREAASDHNVSDDEREVTITLKGQTLINASLAAAQLCVSLRDFLSVLEGDIRREINDDFAESTGSLFDMIEQLDYPSPKIRAQAAANLAMLARSRRIEWIRSMRSQLTQVWPTGLGCATSSRRVYTDGLGYFCYRSDPEELILASSDIALEYMSGGEFPKRAR